MHFVFPGDDSGDGDDGQDIEDGTSAKHTEERHITLWLVSNSKLREFTFNFLLKPRGVSKSDILLGFTSEGIRWLACRLPHTYVLCYAHSEGEGRAPKKGKKGKNESDNVQSKDLSLSHILRMCLTDITGNHGDVEITEEVTSEKLINAHVSTSRLPLVLSEKVQRSKVGTLEGFSFFSEDETDKITKATAHQTDQNMDVEELSNGKIKRKAGKSSGVARKKGKTAGGKPCNV
ncbi:hypothetical protein POTOM_049959 [Populus tomentosa]|uniref:Uncharacterized protein n=1 Tax=Populus tomentosa TaxID=118781 RepID=A0A8X7YAX6_POPTO|nr:hypothetical protein POTOM_049959 [Populus tomentosa]